MMNSVDEVVTNCSFIQGVNNTGDRSIKIPEISSKIKILLMNSYLQRRKQQRERPCIHTRTY